MKLRSIHTFMIAFVVLIILGAFVIIVMGVFKTFSGGASRPGTSDDPVFNDSPMFNAGSNDDWQADNNAAASVASFDPSPSSSFDFSPSSSSDSSSTSSSDSGSSGGSSDGGGASGSW